MDAFSYEEWVKAEPMNLRCGAGSVEAIGLVERLLNELVFPEPLKLLKPSTSEKRRTALRALVADLLKLEARGVVGYHGTSPKDFPSKLLGFGYDVFMPLKDAMIAAGFLDFAPGRQRLGSFTNLATGAKGPVVQSGGYQARFKLTAKALEEVEAAGISLDAWKDHWSPPEPIQSVFVTWSSVGPLVELRASKQRRGGVMRKGESLPVDMDSPVLQPILADLQDHNSFLASAGVSGVDFVGLRRIFNDGDVPHYAWNRGGRFYSRRAEGMGKAYESYKGEQRRRRIKLGGEAVGEVDMSASQLRLLYALLDEPLPEGHSDDLYALTGVRRDVAKLVVTQAIGKESAKPGKWGNEGAQDYAKEHHGRLLEKDHPFAEALTAVLTSHPVLGRLGALDCPSALELQYIESEIIRRAMSALRRDDITSLPVHDSLIVPLSKLEQAENALRDAFAAEVESFIGHPTTVSPRMSRKGL